jgi:hypothetical protein
MENKSGAKFKGEFHLECFRWHDENGVRFRNKRGRFERRLIWEDTFHNILTDEGLNHILNVVLDAATQITTWYVGLSETNTTPVAGLTYAVPSFTESTAYDEATRPEYVEAASTAKSITNSANKAVYTMSATKTIYGAALFGGGTGASTKGNTAGGGKLLCYALCSPSRAVVDNDVINATYTVTSADDGA